MAVVLRVGVVQGACAAIPSREAGTTAEVDAQGQPAAVCVKVQAVDEPRLGQAKGGGEEFVVHGTLMLVDQGRMRHCVPFGQTPACS